MSVFLIDYENLHTSAFSGLEDLTEEDRVFIFYTNNSDNLTFSLMQRLNNARAKIEYLKVNCGGKNSLDFQLCTYLGYLIGVCRDTRFAIVSRDKGYNTMLSFWGDKMENGNCVVSGVTIRNSMDRPAVGENVAQTEELADEAVAPDQLQPQAEQPVEQSEQPIEKPKRKYNRRTPYKRKTKSPAEQSA